MGMGGYNRYETSSRYLIKKNFDGYSRKCHTCGKPLLEEWWNDRNKHWNFCDECAKEYENSLEQEIIEEVPF